MTLLKAFGGEGTAFSGPNLCNVFATGRDANLVCKRRVVTTLMNKQDNLLSWPDKQEHWPIASCIEELCGLPNCVGVVDGALFLLAF